MGSLRGITMHVPGKAGCLLFISVGTSIVVCMILCVYTQYGSDAKADAQRLTAAQPVATHQIGQQLKELKQVLTAHVVAIQQIGQQPCKGSQWVPATSAKTVRVQVPPLIPDDIATLRTAVALVFDRAYMEAGADMVKSLRGDGGWEGDILLVFDADRAELVSHLTKRQFGLNRTVIVHPDDLLPLGTRDAPVFSSSQVAKCLGKTKVSRPYYLKASTIFTTYVKERWDRILYVDSCHTIFTPDVDYFFTHINSQGVLLAAPDPWIWARRGLSYTLNPTCDKVAYTKLKANTSVSLDAKDNFNSALMLFDTSIIEASTIHEIYSVWRDYSSLQFKGKDQELQTIYWHYFKGRYRILPMVLPGTDLIPYSFFRVRGLKYIMGAGHKTRPVCLKRSTNARTIG